MSSCRGGSQCLRPIEDHRDGLLSIRVRFEKDEPAVRGDIVRWRLIASKVGRLKQRHRGLEVEAFRGVDGHSHHLFVLEVVEFASIPRPDRFAASTCRHANRCSRTWIGPDLYLLGAGRVVCVGEPTAIA
jgi:hypothetical protein